MNQSLYLLWWLLPLVLGVALVLYRAKLKAMAAQNRALEQRVQEQTAAWMHQQEETKALGEFLKISHEDRLASQQAEQNARLEAEQARQEADAANQAKRIFLAMISHEIRTPMNGVIGSAVLLAETALTEEQHEYTETIKNSGERLLDILNDILDFSRIESGKLVLEAHEFDLRTCVEEVLDLFSRKAAQIGLDLIYQIDSNIPAQIVGDRLRLRQVLINLVGNALKFTPRGEVFLAVKRAQSPSILPTDFQLELTVRDTGIGIPVAKLASLFQPFSQGDSATTRRYGGIGLGLAISERLVNLMGGHMSVESQEGKGTTVKVHLPARAGQQATRRYVHRHLDLVGKQILVVDDNRTNRQILEAQLAQWQCVPTLAESGSEALHLLDEGNRFDLIITDRLMPEMDGIQLAQTVRISQPHVPLILLSSIGDEQHQDGQFLFSSVLTKPVKQQQFLQVIQAALTHPPSSMEKTTIGVPESKKILSDAFAKAYPMQILIAEDNPINQKLVVRILTKLGYEPTLAVHGKDAVEKVGLHAYELILMDVQMPEMDGLEVTQWIRQHLSKQPYIIAMTANAMPGDQDYYLQAGMDNYLSKPIKLEDLVSMLGIAALKMQGVF